MALSHFTETKSNCPSYNAHIAEARFWASTFPTLVMSIAFYSTKTFSAFGAIEKHILHNMDILETLCI